MFDMLLVYLGQPVAVEDRSVESLLLIDVGEVFKSNHVDVFICPPSLFIPNQPEIQFITFKNQSSNYCAKDLLNKYRNLLTPNQPDTTILSNLKH